MQQNSRALGELLLQDDAVAVDGGVAVPSTAFQTRGWQNLWVTIVNPTWATNPATLTAALRLSTDAFDTEDFVVVALDGVEIVQNLVITDAYHQAFVLTCMSNAGAIAATNTPLPIPVPDIDGMTARILFTPTGAGVTTETMTVNVYGVTPR